MIPSIVHQITAACIPRPAERPSPRKLRQENILMLMLGRNVTTLELMRHQKKSRRMISDDLAEMIEAGHVFAFSAASSVDYRSRMYSLTKAGIERAKRLKEMSDG